MENESTNNVVSFQNYISSKFSGKCGIRAIDNNVIPSSGQETMTKSEEAKAILTQKVYEHLIIDNKDPEVIKILSSDKSVNDKILELNVYQIVVASARNHVQDEIIGRLKALYEKTYRDNEQTNK